MRLVLRKRIPAGGGLGGGSADAAAALLAVRELLDVDIDDAGVLALAAEVGSDVPFCLRGGAAWMRGRGEIIEPVSRADRARVRGGDPAVPAVDAGRLPRPGTSSAARASERVVPAPRRLAHVIAELVNDLEPAAEALEPRLRRVPRRARGRGRRAALLAGSGSAYVVPVADARRLPALVDEVSRRLRVPVVGTTSVAAASASS